MFPSVNGRLVIDVESVVPENGMLNAYDAWKLGPGKALPAGVAVEIHIGKTRHLVGDLSGMALDLATAASIVVVGEDDRGIGAVYRALSEAYGVFPEVGDDDDYL